MKKELTAQEKLEARMKPMTPAADADTDEADIIIKVVVKHLPGSYSLSLKELNVQNVKNPMAVIAGLTMAVAQAVSVSAPDRTPERIAAWFTYCQKFIANVYDQSLESALVAEQYDPLVIKALQQAQTIDKDIIEFVSKMDSKQGETDGNN